jgi:hypothetical protein
MRHALWIKYKLKLKISINEIKKFDQLFLIEIPPKSVFPSETIKGLTLNKIYKIKKINKSNDCSTFEFINDKNKACSLPCSFFGISTETAKTIFSFDTPMLCSLHFKTSKKITIKKLAKLTKLCRPK